MDTPDWPFWVKTHGVPVPAAVEIMYCGGGARNGVRVEDGDSVGVGVLAGVLESAGVVVATGVPDLERNVKELDRVGNDVRVIAGDTDAVWVAGGELEPVDSGVCDAEKVETGVLVPVDDAVWVLDLVETGVDGGDELPVDEGVRLDVFVELGVGDFEHPDMHGERSRMREDNESAKSTRPNDLSPPERSAATANNTLSCASTETPPSPEYPCVRFPATVLICPVVKRMRRTM